MAASKRRSSSRWSDLPPDLLSVVLQRLHSLTDRVRFGAACRPWRSAAYLHCPNLPPPMPWLALGDKAYLDIVNGGAARKLSLGFVPDNARCRGSADHLLFLTRGRGGAGGCFLADPFTGAVLPVADLAMFIEHQTRQGMFSLRYNHSRLRVQKVVLLWPPHGGCSSPEPPVPVVAALIKNKNLTNELKTTIFVCRAGTDTGVTKESYGSMSINLRLIKDVAFFRGDLYALSTLDQLLVIGLGEGSAGAGGGNPAITGVKYVIRSPNGVPYNNFLSEKEDEMFDLDLCEFEGIRPATGDERLVQSGDQLLMLRRWVIHDGTSSSGNTGIFDIYEADFGDSQCRWKTASSLRGHALFLGQYCSKSVPVGDGHYGALEDCIYFVQDDAGDSGIYDMEYCKVRPLVPNIEEVMWQLMQPWIPTWIFPDQSIIQAHYLKKSAAERASDDNRDVVPV
ncbi:unnamed protein product [Urochloa humidicola]